MIEIKREGVLLSKTQFEFESEGVLNPAVIREGDNVHLFYRAVQHDNYSSIGYCKLNGPLTITERWAKPFMIPDLDYESHGIEDPRIVKIDDTYYMTYTAYDGVNARGALATSKDLLTFEKQGIIVSSITYAAFVALVEQAGKVNENYYLNHHFYYQESDPEKKMILWDKNVVFFPRKINGKLVFLHRIRPGIQLVAVESLKELTEEFWETYFLNLQDHIVIDPLFAHESSYIGSGCPPIETEHGWLLIYHGVQETDGGRVYSACAAVLLDIDNPLKVIARLPYPLLGPETEYETRGEVNNVVFPTGTALFDDTLFIYYGAADSEIACASVSISGLLKELLTYLSDGEIPLL
ncbi:MAG: pesticidal protein Cry7Aa [Paludibacteraceae bacterium]|nr:pesticidal protein Cry7Aa [Paludibacteraceae bacterium]